jgi:DeoR/GlpR family transcriptional regulator of sugar metabolism
MGATAINEKYEVLTPSIEKRTMKPLVLRHSSKSYLLADDNKFDKNSTYVIYTLTDFTGVITTKKFTEQELKQMENLGINIIGLS